MKILLLVALTLFVFKKANATTAESSAEFLEKTAHEICSQKEWRARYETKTECKTDVVQRQSARRQKTSEEQAIQDAQIRQREGDNEAMKRAILFQYLQQHGIR